MPRPTGDLIKVRRKIYKVLCHIGSGGMSEVYEVEDSSNKKIFALKEVSPDHPQLTSDPMALEEAKRCLKMEYLSLTKLQHPSIPKAFNYELGNYSYLVMTYIDGENLKSKVGQLSEDEVIEVAEQLLGTLTYLHGGSTPYIVRDLKPDNFLRDVRGRIFMVDFGTVAMQMAGAKYPPIGTPGYVHPNIYTGTSPSPAIDIYSLGACLWELMTGQEPPDFADKCIVNGKLVPGVKFEIPPIATYNPAVSQEFSDIVTKALNFELAAPTFANAEEFLEAIRNLSMQKQGMPVASMPTGFMVVPPASVFVTPPAPPVLSSGGLSPAPSGALSSILQPTSTTPPLEPQTHTVEVAGNKISFITCNPMSEVTCGLIGDQGVTTSASSTAQSELGIFP